MSRSRRRASTGLMTKGGCREPKYDQGNINRSWAGRTQEFLSRVASIDATNRKRVGEMDGVRTMSEIRSQAICGEGVTASCNLTSDVSVMLTPRVETRVDPTEPKMKRPSSERNAPIPERFKKTLKARLNELDFEAKATKSTSRHRLPIGDVLAGRYTIKQLVGVGGIGEVYRAHDECLSRDVAVKVLSGASAADLKTQRRFAREIRSAASLSHPNVMALFDVGEHEETQFAVLELVSGCVLRRVMERGLSTRRALEIATGVAAGLAAAHEIDLMHRDIKPENVMVSSDGHAKVLDFGLARTTQTAGSQRLTQTSMIIGTVPYMSPEQAEGRALACSTDVFSLGTMLFEMLTGTNPFAGASAVQTIRKLVSPNRPSLRQYQPDLPDSLADLVGAMLSLRPDDRPDARAVLHALQDIALCRVSCVTHGAPSNLKGNTQVAKPVDPCGTTKQVTRERE